MARDSDYVRRGTPPSQGDAGCPRGTQGPGGGRWRLLSWLLLASSWLKLIPLAPPSSLLLATALLYRFSFVLGPPWFLLACSFLGFLVLATFLEGVLA